MRRYTNLLQAVREVEREMKEMSHVKRPTSMQNFRGSSIETRELLGYAFILDVGMMNLEQMARLAVTYIHPEEHVEVLEYIVQEHLDRTGGKCLNPGNAWKTRPDVWTQFLDGKQFHYTYSERITPQLDGLIDLLAQDPASRQAVLTIHTNLEVNDPRLPITSFDWANRRGQGRVPCSLNYQFIMNASGALCIIYNMRSCDFLTHFTIDVILAAKMLHWVAARLGVEVGSLHYNAASLHAYKADIDARGIF